MYKGKGKPMLLQFLLSTQHPSFVEAQRSGIFRNGIQNSAGSLAVDSVLYFTVGFNANRRWVLIGLTS